MEGNFNESVHGLNTIRAVFFAGGRVYANDADSALALMESQEMNQKAEENSIKLDINLGDDPEVAFDLINKVSGLCWMNAYMR